MMLDESPKEEEKDTTVEVVCTRCVAVNVYLCVWMCVVIECGRGTRVIEGVCWRHGAKAFQSVSSGWGEVCA